MFNKEKLKQLLKEKNLSQRDFAAGIFVSQPLVLGILKGYKVPSLAVAKRIADYFEVSLDELMQ